VKPVSRLLRDINLFSGNTILGDGAVVLIIDPNGLARRFGSDALRNGAEGTAPSATDELAEPDTILVFRGGAGDLKALPLALVTRLEEVDGSSIEQSGGRARIQYRGRLIPVVPVDPEISLAAERQPLVIVSDGERTMGLAVREIVDVVECALAIEPGGGPDSLGSAIVRGRATDLIDLAAYLPRAHEGWSALGGAPPSGSLLLVDDNAFFREMLTPVLRAAGYRVRAAASLEEAMRAVSVEAVDILVTDLELGGRSGLELVQRLRRAPRNAQALVIGLASGLDEAELDRARSLGVHDIVAKFDRSGLLAAIAEGTAPETAATERWAA
ncbi:MAG: response regulator, partial [Methylobacteriaceae bacterium]|nr:response regulator [Methylobacteriaceae bacterium]